MEEDKGSRIPLNMEVFKGNNKDLEDPLKLHENLELKKKMKKVKILNCSLKTGPHNTKKVLEKSIGGANILQYFHDCFMNQRYIDLIISNGKCRFKCHKFVVYLLCPNLRPILLQSKELDNEEILTTLIIPQITNEEILNMVKKLYQLKDNEIQKKFKNMENEDEDEEEEIEELEDEQDEKDSYINSGNSNTMNVDQHDDDEKEKDLQNIKMEIEDHDDNPIQIPDKNDINASILSMKKKSTFNDLPMTFDNSEIDARENLQEMENNIKMEFEEHGLESLDKNADKNNKSTTTSSSASCFVKCEICQVDFGTSKGFWNHHVKFHVNDQIIILGDDDKTVCKYCNLNLKYKFAKIMHEIHCSYNMDEKSGDLLNPYSCHVCHQLYSTFGSLKEHFRENHVSEENNAPNQIFTCELCGRKCKSKGMLQYHQLIHERTFDCQICEKSFKATLLEQEHRVENHVTKEYISDIERLTCKFCDKEYFIKYLRVIHETVCKKNGGPLKLPYECNICGKRSKKILDAKKHHFTHFNDEEGAEFMCQFCSKPFASKSVLIHHEKSHSFKYKTTNCHFCDKKFANRKELIAHFETHPDYRRYVCDICGKKFASGNKMRFHRENVHSKESKRETCEYCGIQFKYKLSKITHQKRNCKSIDEQSRTVLNYQNTYEAPSND